MRLRRTMRLTGKRLLLSIVVLIAAVSVFLWLGRDDNSLRLNVQVSGTVIAMQAGAEGQFRASGTGLANSPFGNVTLSGSGGGSGGAEANCVTFDGSGTLATAAGALQLRLPKPARACLTAATVDQATGDTQLKVSAKVEADGTDGSLLGRHGSLAARGTYNPDTGSFTVRFSGRLRR